MTFKWSGWRSLQRNSKRCPLSLNSSHNVFGMDCTLVTPLTQVEIARLPRNTSFQCRKSRLQIGSKRFSEIYHLSHKTQAEYIDRKIVRIESFKITFRRSLCFTGPNFVLIRSLDTSEAVSALHEGRNSNALKGASFFKTALHVRELLIYQTVSYVICETSSLANLSKYSHSGVQSVLWNFPWQ